MGRKGWKAGGPFRPSSRNLSQLREAASQSDRAAVSWDQTPRDSFAAPQWSIPRRAQNSSGPRQQRVRSGVGVSPPPFRQPLPPLLRGTLYPPTGCRHCQLTCGLRAYTITARRDLPTRLHNKLGGRVFVSLSKTSPQES